jgi:hypothetical protein
MTEDIEDKRRVVGPWRRVGVGDAELMIDTQDRVDSSINAKGSKEGRVDIVRKSSIVDSMWSKMVGRMLSSSDFAANLAFNHI